MICYLILPIFEKVSGSIDVGGSVVPGAGLSQRSGSVKSVLVPISVAALVVVRRTVSDFLTGAQTDALFGKVYVVSHFLFEEFVVDFFSRVNPGEAVVRGKLHNLWDLELEIWQIMETGKGVSIISKMWNLMN